MKSPLVLLGSKREPGHLVIINDVDQPCCRLLAAVKSVTPGSLVALSLCESVDMAECSTGAPQYATPVDEFGFFVLSDGKHVWCEKERESTAVYPDGVPRPWQDWQLDVMHVAKAAVLRAAMKAARESKGGA